MTCTAFIGSTYTVNGHLKCWNLQEKTKCSQKVCLMCSYTLFYSTLINIEVELMGNLSDYVRDTVF